MGCWYCGYPEATQMDHFIPRSRGGRNDDDNLVPACRPCNMDKRAMLLDEWYMSRLSRGLYWPPEWSPEERDRSEAVGRKCAGRGRIWFNSRWLTREQVAQLRLSSLIAWHEIGMPARNGIPGCLNGSDIMAMGELDWGWEHDWEAEANR